MKENSLKMQEAKKGCWVEDAESWAQVGGLLQPRRPTSLPSDRTKEGRVTAVRFGGS